MIMAYVNYPNPRISVHHEASCGTIQQQGKADQRFVKINPGTISVEIERFTSRVYTFASNPAANDMWIELDFGDEEFERAVLCYLQRLIGQCYAPLARVPIEYHC